MQRLLAQKTATRACYEITYATTQVEFFFAANAGNFILAITAMAGAVSLARTMTDPIQHSIFATARSRISSKQQNGQTSWLGAAPLFRDWHRARFLDLVFGECK